MLLKMKKGLLVLCLLLGTVASFAQSRYSMPAVWTEQGYKYMEEPAPLKREMRAVEVELGVGFPFGVHRLREAGFGRYRTGVTGMVEVRYNLKRAPFDVGFQLRPTALNRDLSSDRGGCTFTSVALMATSDYNFRRGTDCSIFVGIGAGCAYLTESAAVRFDEHSGAFYDNGPQASVCVMPRAGIEICDHWRITFAYQFMERANRNFSIAFGVSFGGGRKSNSEWKKQIVPAIIDSVIESAARR